MYSLNIVLLSIRSTDLAKQIISLACDAARKYPGVSLSLGYGGTDEVHAQSIADNFSAINQGGGEVRLFRNPEIGFRLAQCLESAKTWTLFISDDDEFSHNFLEAMAETTRGAGENVGLITASEYRIMDGEVRTQVIKPPAFTADRAERYKRVLPSGLPLFAYYSAHRTSVVREWFGHLQKRNFVPGHSDQTLVTLSALTGTVIPTSASTYFTKENGNWKDFENVTNGHARFYPSREMTLFNELFMSTDLYLLVRDKPYFPEIARVHFHRWNWDMSYTFKAFIRRARALNIRLSYREILSLCKVAALLPLMWLDWDISLPNRGADRMAALAKTLEAKSRQ